MRSVFVAAAMALLTNAAHAQERPGSFVDAGARIPGLALEMRYAGAENFVGRPIEGYEAPRCLLTRQAGEALAAAQQRLAPFGLGLKVFDCYRPARAVADFAAWAADPNDQARKTDYYPNVDKAQLFTLGYLAARSGHSRGSTVDLTIIDLATGAEIDMGGAYDLFDPRSSPMNQSIAPAQRANRLLLRSIMQEHGFQPLAEEWWHFTLRREPYPRTYFDFPITRE
jgi:zinc D-Ala-D-Ala dipeptidase